MNYVSSRICDETRKVLEDDLDQYFGKVEDGNDLDSVVEEVLKDRGLFDFLAVNLEEGKGLWLGAVEYQEDRSFYDHYGLTLNFEVTRKTNLFVFDSMILEREFAAQGLGAKLIKISNRSHHLAKVNSMLQSQGSMFYHMFSKVFPAKRNEEYT